MLRWDGKSEAQLNKARKAMIKHEGFNDIICGKFF